MARRFKSASSESIKTAGTSGAPGSVRPASFAGWFYEITRLSGAGNPAAAHLLWSANDGPSSFFNEMSSDNGVLNYVNSGAWQSTGTTIPLAKWTHIALTLDGATPNNFKVYLNGASVASGTWSNGTIRRLPIIFGAWADVVTAGNATGGWFDGFIADFGLWNVGLTASEILFLARGIRPPSIRGNTLIGYWPLSGLVPNYEPDITPYANNGTLIGTSIAPDPPFLPNMNQILVTIPAEREMPALSGGISFIPGWSRQSNLPVIGGGTF